MQGKTHIAGAIATATLVTQPRTVGELLLCVGVSAVGGAVCDVDVDGSIGSKKLKQVSGFGVVVVLLLGVALLTGRAEFSSVVARDNSIVRTCFGVVAAFAVCWFGRRQPHRSFMHSILGVVLMSASSYLVFTEVWRYVAVGMLSHIALDLLNKKRIRLFYPLKKPKVALGLCTADGAVNTVLFYAFSVACLFEVGACVYRILF